MKVEYLFKEAEFDDPDDEDEIEVEDENNNSESGDSLQWWMNTPMIPHENKIIFAERYNTFRTRMMEFLDSHRQQGTAVRKQDVEDFFKSLREEPENKRRKLN